MEQFFVSLDKLARESHLTVAYTPCELEKIKVTASKLSENPANAAPGSVLAVKPLTIACQDGAIVLDSVTPEGGKSMAGTAWAAGRRLKAGDSL